jgi:hypothetical protein
MPLFRCATISGSGESHFHFSALFVNSSSWTLAGFPSSLSLFHTFLLSLITLPIQPKPATSTTFSCQLRRTLIAAPLDSPPPGRGACCENPVDCGVSPEPGRPKVGCREVDVVAVPELMPLYRYFMIVSRISEPPSLSKIRCSMGVMSEALMDWRTSVMVWRCISCN